MTRKTIASLPEDSQGIVRLVRSLAVGLVIALLILGAAVVGTYLRGENTRNIITRSACAEDPAGQECAKVRAETALHEPIRNSCIPYQRVTSRRGRNCPKFYVSPGPMGSVGAGGMTTNSGGVGEQGSDGSGRGSVPVVDGGDDAPAPGPGKGGSEDPQTPGQGGGGSDPAPPAGPSPATPPVVQPPPAAAAPEPESQPPKSVLTPTLEGVQKGAGEVVGGVGGTVETVGCKLEGTC